MVDDPAPCINPLYYFRKQVNKIEAPTVGEGIPMIPEIPNDFLVQFVELVHQMGIKGKFSLLPYPAGLGSIETGLEGFKREDVEEFVSLVRDELTPNFDITPEVLTHTLALDLKTYKLKDISEHDWSQKQDRNTLREYIGEALRILKNVGIDANGVTSPCNFGQQVEEEYAGAILDAQKAINGRSLSWYFLHVEVEEKCVLPQLMHLDRASGEAVVSIVSGCGDHLWQTMGSLKTDEDYISAIADNYISSDGTKGRLLELFNNASYIVFHTHWQSLFSNGSRIGLKILEEVASRINRVLGNRVVWMKCGEIAHYFATAHSAVVRVEEKDKEIYLSIDSPLRCKSFTLSLMLDREIKEVKIFRDRKSLKRVEGCGGMLNVDTWFQEENRIYICIDLNFKIVLVLQ